MPSRIEAYRSWRVNGCCVAMVTEQTDGCAFVRVSVRGTHAARVLEDVLRRQRTHFKKAYDLIDGSSVTYTTGEDWVGLLAGRAKHPTRRWAGPHEKGQPSRPWSMAERARLREVYEAEGLAGCFTVFRSTRSYHAINAALVRYHVRPVVQRERQEA